LQKTRTVGSTSRKNEHITANNQQITSGKRFYQVKNSN